MKRIFDVAASALALIILSPVILVLMLVVRLKMGRPIFFRQMRAGKHGRMFEMIKFRTMASQYDSEGNSLSEEERTGKLGRFLRASSLDELPELWNILIGNMSVVGPRPLLIEYLPYYTETEARRHDVRPGLTGLAQVSGRNSLSWEDRLALDVQYVENQSLWLDMKIIIKTAFKVVSKSDVQVITGGTNRLDDARRKQQQKVANVE